MTATLSWSLGARDAYEAIAPAYDVLTAGYPYERWLDQLEALARRHGLAGRRLLDVACGTGASFLPMVARGYEVTACDISPAMLARARSKAPGVDLRLADMRRLPRLGAFDLLTCLDDSLNYLLEEEELQAALEGFAANLHADGLAAWDLNTLAQYRGQFSNDRIVAAEELYVGWSARPGERIEANAVVEVGIDVFSPAPGEGWRREAVVHRQRHWPAEQVRTLCRRSGLRLLGVWGQRTGGVIEGDLDELVHTKAVFLAGRR